MKNFFVHLNNDREIVIKADKFSLEGERYVFYSEAGDKVDDVYCAIVTRIQPENGDGGMTSGTAKPSAVRSLLGVVGCWFGNHVWNGCICSICSSPRDEQHRWLVDCERCSQCGKQRPNVHTWNGCVCILCGQKRDAGHDWSSNCEKCTRCGSERRSAHVWQGCKCIQCSTTRDVDHSWDGCTCVTCGSKREEGHLWNSTTGRCAKCGRLDPAKFRSYVSALKDMAQREDESIRRNPWGQETTNIAARHVGVMKSWPPECIPFLVKALNETDDAVQAKACHALRLVGSKHPVPQEATSSLRRLSNHSGKYIRAEAANALRTIIFQ